LVAEQILFLDIESSNDGTIHKIGAILDSRKLSSVQCGGVAQALVELEQLADNAAAVGGHNIVAHDLPLLKSLHPQLKIFNLPVIDTLHLSPLCFPENPYHHLVKDYKLLSQSINDPTADALLSKQLFIDELSALNAISQHDPELFRALAVLTCGGAGAGYFHARGMRWLFESIAPGSANTADSGLADLTCVLSRYACCTAVASLTRADITTTQSQWAMAFALSWLRVAGGNSVLPAWVRFSYPESLPLLHHLRDIPCTRTSCGYCAEIHNPEKQLARFFGFNEFRNTPPNQDGGSLQRDIVVAGMRGESLLAILPTGGGKSLCFQLPALSRHLRRGQLTIVISPLQALMKDQVDGLLRRTGMDNVAALYGMLTMPERGDVHRRVVSGGIAILYVSPEQLRNKSFIKTVMQREIGAWVIDEAHCLSKWGHDFRPDYLYIAKVVKEIALQQRVSAPPVTCFTATAKQDVVDEIINYFKSEITGEIALFRGGVERDNLSFEVQTVSIPAKFAKINHLLHERLGSSASRLCGSAIIFRVTQRATEELAEYLTAQGWSAAHFHAGLPAPVKKRTQDAFINGEIRVICATNAFGMGIDKDDVRVVIHADTPGSLENYLQEAGRAGRDREPADCILLYDEEDCEQQFRLGAYSELRRRDIAQILRGLRRAAGAASGEEIVITTGELLRDQEVETTFYADDKSADTKVRSAVSWLERAGFVERSHNRTSVFQARLTIQTLDEAQKIIDRAQLSRDEARLWIAITTLLINRDPDDHSLTIDSIALLPEFQLWMQEASRLPVKNAVERRSHEFLSAKVFRTLNAMTELGLLKKDTLLNAYVRYKVVNSSREIFTRICIIEDKFINLLREEEPDPEGWVSLNLRGVNQVLTEHGFDSSVLMLKDLLRSLSEDGRGFAGSCGSVDIFPVSREQYRLRLRRSWDALGQLARRRCRVASVILTAIIAKIPPATPPGKELLVEFSFEELTNAVDADLELRREVRDQAAAVERALLFLHEQGVAHLQQGLAIFRSAMTIRVLPEAKGQQYTRHHYQALQYHYNERVFQVHVMREYAQSGLTKIQQALNLVLAYFSLSRNQFIEKFFAGRNDILERATTAASYQKIVDDLGNIDQMRVVKAPLSRNMLILAGPGSGKTRTVVHRCAYLLRVERVRGAGILICCFNHQAAVELRQRLFSIAGNDARGVTVQTYHGLAMRLLGLSVAAMNEEHRDGLNFDGILEQAVQLLEGGQTLAGMEADETRERLLSGYEYILVDEYQDIDEMQYRMISAIAGRTLKDADRKLSICAVGDDDQSIYGFRGANITFLQRFEKDFEAEIHYLVDNYRSTRNIIDAANHLIAFNRDRMKLDKPIRIDKARRTLPAAGVVAAQHPLTGGRVGVINVANPQAQATAIIAEIERLLALKDVTAEQITVLSRNRDDLVLIRELAEAKSIPVSWLINSSAMPPLYRVREFYASLSHLDQSGATYSTASQLKATVVAGPINNWSLRLLQLLELWIIESADAELPAALHTSYLYEALALSRGSERFGSGVVLSTVHAVKGMEFNHVLLCGKWSRGHNRHELEEERRVFYTGMTRAKQSLSIYCRMDQPHPFVAQLAAPAFIHRSELSDTPVADLSRKIDYTLLSLKDMFLDYAGRSPEQAAIHAHLRRLEVGSKCVLKASGEHLQLVDMDGNPVGRLSAAAERVWGSGLSSVLEITVLAIHTRLRGDVKEAEYLQKIRTEVWEIPICEIKHLRTGLQR